MSPGYRDELHGATTSCTAKRARSPTARERRGNQAGDDDCPCERMCATDVPRTFLEVKHEIVAILHVLPQLVTPCLQLTRVVDGKADEHEASVLACGTQPRPLLGGEAAAPAHQLGQCTLAQHPRRAHATAPDRRRSPRSMGCSAASLTAMGATFGRLDELLRPVPACAQRSG